jgi:hypothetical protein
LARAWGFVDQESATDVWSKIGSLVGVVADVAGAVSGIGAVVELAATIIGLTSDANAAIEAQLQTLIGALNTLIAQNQIDAIVAYQKNVDNAVAYGQAGFDQLKALLPPNPPPSQDQVTSAIRGCLQTLDILDNDDEWRKWPFSTQLYYDDGGAWMGQIVPTPQPDGLVFSTAYILPRFVLSLSQLLAVGFTLDPRFVANYAGDPSKPVNRYINRLQWVCSTALDGIVVLRAPAPAELVETTSDDNGNPSYVSLGGFCVGPWGRGLNGVPTSLSPNPDWYQMYGAVDRYGNYFLAGNYPPVPVPAAPPANGAPAADFLNAFGIVHTIRSRDAGRQVFQQLGLGQAYAILSQVKAIVGDSSPDGSQASTNANLKVWSLKDLAAIGAPILGTSRPIRLSAVLAALNKLSSGANKSLRGAIGALIIPVALSGAPTLVQPAAG